MGPLGVVVRPPVVENLLGLGDRGKPMLREALASQRAIEGLDQAVVPRFPGTTEVELDVIQYAQASSAREVNSVPLSTVIQRGSPRWAPTARSARATSSPRKWDWATRARLSRV